MSKKWLIGVLLSGIFLLSIVIGVAIHRLNTVFLERDGIQTLAIVDGMEFKIMERGRLQTVFLKGVNLGAAKPGTFPGELAITREEYRRWFSQIAAMGANVIRVYTTMKPHFYEELLHYNENSSAPLYLLQGVWVNEEEVKRLHDPYAEERKIIDEFIGDAIDLVDILHGNKTLPVRPGFASGTYTADVTPYVIGWILGVEWHPDFVDTTNRLYHQEPDYSGTYVGADSASHFEHFLAEVGDRVLGYEIEQYQMTRPLSFTNWLTTDPLTHDNEPDPLKEDFVEVNVEKIHLSDLAFAGQFASYHVYPYYPEFINYQPEYAEWVDPITGEVNPYQAYLEDLKSVHTMPVLVAEFGVPGSRGMAHLNPTNNYNQGQHNETEQGEILVKLIGDIVAADCMGAVLFSWQDEWFKRTWNTMDFDLEWQRPFWSNVQTNEQMFGLLAFDPGLSESIVHLDGNLSEWTPSMKLSEQGSTRLYATSDERYLYVAIEDSTVDFLTETWYLPIDTIANQGNTSYHPIAVMFDRSADFVVRIDGETNTRLLVDAYYDPFEHLYATLSQQVPSSLPGGEKNSGLFNPIRHALSAQLYLPKTQVTIPFQAYEAGLLQRGYSNPAHPNYDSLADIQFGEGVVELRIPWLLLNVMDPSTKQILADFKPNLSFQPQTVEGFYIGALNKTQTRVLSSTLYAWTEWYLPVSHERLKKSYYLVQEAFQAIP
jgi:hypothetical protein